MRKRHLNSTPPGQFFSTLSQILKDTILLFAEPLFEYFIGKFHGGGNLVLLFIEVLSTAS